MSHTPHELHDVFPADAELLHQLKLSNPHFVHLAERYHDVNREVHRIESEVEAASDDRLEALKKQRLHLLDEIADLLAKARAAA
jgi:uncharacterized protein YdcH (DUF465 family)